MWQYSMAIDVAGALIEAVEGTSLGEAVAKHVTGPLGMADTLFGASDPERLSIAYANLPDGGTERMRAIHTMLTPWDADITFHPGRIFNKHAFQSGGGGMAGTAPDFLKLLDALLADGQPILSPKLAAQAFANQIGTVPRDTEGEGFSYFGALAYNPAASGQPVSPGTVRWGGVYGNHWFADPVEKLALVAFTNTALEGCDGDFRFEIRDAAYPVD
jgi:CubicO group peptidase (beta-lactamase class C family)